MGFQIWVYADFHNKNNLGLLGKAHSLACTCKGQVAAVCTTALPDDDLLIHSGADIVYRLSVKGSNTKQAQTLCALCEQYHPEVLLFPTSVEYSTIAARTAAQLGTGLTADCTELTIDKNGLLLQTRPAFGGGLIADIYCEHKRPQMATVRPGIFPIPEPDPQRTGIHIPYIPPALPPDPAKLLSRERILAKADLREGRIIVAGGKGIGSREGFKLLAALAARIDGLLGATRSAVDAGYASYDCQIGQTGMTVSPKLYIAFGISGAPQHIAGMSMSGKVIAVNNDPKAPIFDYADLAIIGDWREMSEAIIINCQSTANCRNEILKYRKEDLNEL